MSLAQRLGGGPQSSSGDFVFAVGFPHTEPQSLMDSWERQQPGLGWEGSDILQRPHVAATSFTPLFFFLPGGELEVVALILDYLVLTGLLNFLN